MLLRSIGDFDLKNQGVVADADVTRISIKHGKDKFLVLTTGDWFLSSKALFQSSQSSLMYSFYKARLKRSLLPILIQE